MSYKKVIINKFGGPEELRLIEEQHLPVPLAGEVRIKVMATSAAFTDVMIRMGKYPDVKKSPPFSLGYDMVGIIDSLGESANRFLVGQVVADLTVIGAYSEYICLPESSLTLVPEGLDPAEVVSLVLSYVTAYQMLNRVAKLKAGDSILVHGGGGAVGSALLQLGHIMGLTLYSTVSKSKHVLIEKLGGFPIDYKNENFIDYIKQHQSEGVKAVFDGIGGDNYHHSFNCLKPNGILVGFGFYNTVMGKGGNIIADFLRLKLWNFLPNRKSTAFYSIAALRKQHPNWFKEDLTSLLKLLEQKKIAPIIDQRLELSDVKKAHELIEDSSIKGKVVLMPAGITKV